jgi:hypothetical protein
MSAYVSIRLTHALQAKARGLFGADATLVDRDGEAEVGGGGGAEGLRVLAVQLRFGGHLNYSQVYCYIILYGMLTCADVC